MQTEAGQHPPGLRGRELGMWYAEQQKKRQAEGGRHPPGLRGREIGMWHAKKNRRKHAEAERNSVCYSQFIPINSVLYEIWCKRQSLRF